MQPMIECRGLVKRFVGEGNEVTALNGIDL